MSKLSIPVATVLNALISIIFLKYLAINDLVTETAFFVEFKVNLQYWINLLFLGANYAVYHYRRNHDQYGFIMVYILLLVSATLLHYFFNIEATVLIIALTYICIRLYAIMETWLYKFLMLSGTILFVNCSAIIFILSPKHSTIICMFILVIFLVQCGKKIMHKPIKSTLNMLNIIKQDGVFVFGQGLLLSYYTVQLIEFISDTSIGITVALSYQYFALSSMIVGVATTYLAPRIFQSDNAAVLNNFFINIFAVLICGIAFYFGESYIVALLYDDGLNYGLQNTILIYFALSLQLAWQPFLASLNAQSNYFYSSVILLIFVAIVQIAILFDIKLNIILTSVCVVHLILCLLFYIMKNSSAHSTSVDL